mmetsp:Transcript_25935/g.62279  ORF Transcript_25935/g.62279 Transcript_25935/m.62279 type:complete len:267 (-) Transcript_25935:812-1612(-)
MVRTLLQHRRWKSGARYFESSHPRLSWHSAMKTRKEEPRSSATAPSPQTPAPRDSDSAPHFPTTRTSRPPRWLYGRGWPCASASRSLACTTDRPSRRGGGRRWGDSSESRKSLRFLPPVQRRRRRQGGTTGSTQMQRVRPCPRCSLESSPADLLLHPFHRPSIHEYHRRTTRRMPRDEHTPLPNTCLSRPNFVWYRTFSSPPSWEIRAPATCRPSPVDSGPRPAWRSSAPGTIPNGDAGTRGLWIGTLPQSFRPGAPYCSTMRLVR